MGIELVWPERFQINGEGPLLVYLSRVAQVKGQTTQWVWRWIIKSKGGAAFASDGKTLQKVQANGRIENAACFLFGSPVNFQKNLSMGGVYVLYEDIEPLLESG